jgi:cyclic pyranopterin phosphate synthase
MAMMKNLEDPFGRRFPYLRLSVTDVCNFSCSYCLPDGYKKSGPELFMNVDEIRRVATAFAGMGTWKVRLTGGEPTVRPDFIEVAKTVAAVPGIRRLAMTTNGYKLPERAADYYRAGVRAINISIDSLRPAMFREITGHDRLGEVLDGLQACIALGFESVKINTVMLKGMNDGELDDFIAFAETNPVSLRFIELMQTGNGDNYFKTHHLTGNVVREKLLAQGWRLKPREEGGGPAAVYEKPGHSGTIGLIAPSARDFCATCNRLRVSARGQLQLCLFGEGGHNLRPLLQSDDQIEELQEKVMSLLRIKKETHFLHDGLTGATPHLASIGG